MRRSLLAWIKNTFAPTIECRPKPAPCPPRVESLEDRTVPTATVTIEAFGDTAEGLGPMQRFRLTRTETAGSLTVTLSPSGTATALMDYSFTPSVTFNGIAQFAYVTITPINDSIVEPTETITMTIQPGGSYIVGTPSAATINLMNYGPDPPTVTISTIAHAAEPGTVGTIRLTRDGSITSPLPVTVAVSGTATPGQDFSYLFSQYTIPQDSATLDIAVTPIDNSTTEPTETVVLTITSSSSYFVGTPSSATVSIIDNDVPPEVTVAYVNDTAEGSPTPGKFRFTRTGSTTEWLTATYTVGGSAIAGSDYTALSGVVIFASGSATADVIVTAIDDSIPEFDDSVTVEIQSASGHIIGSASYATVIIRDNEQPLVAIEKIYDALEGSWSG